MKLHFTPQVRPFGALRRLGRAAAFTLLEMVVALAAFVLLIGGIFAISQGTVELSNDMSLSQERTLLRGNFIEFMRRSFRTLPGSAELRLSVKQRGSSYVPTINIVNGGTSFTPGPSLAPDTSAEVFADERPGGYLRVSLRILDDKQTQSLRAGQAVRYSRNEPTIVLMDNVSRFEWRFYDAATNRWENNWKGTARPIMAEMNLQLDDGFESRTIFWIPPVVPNGLGGAAAPGTGGPGTGGPGTGGPGTGGPGTGGPGTGGPGGGVVQP